MNPKFKYGDMVKFKKGAEAEFYKDITFRVVKFNLTDEDAEFRFQYKLFPENREMTQFAESHWVYEEALTLHQRPGGF